MIMTDICYACKNAANTAQELAQERSDGIRAILADRVERFHAQCRGCDCTDYEGPRHS